MVLEALISPFSCKNMVPRHTFSLSVSDTTALHFLTCMQDFALPKPNNSTLIVTTFLSASKHKKSVVNNSLYKFI